MVIVGYVGGEKVLECSSVKEAAKLVGVRVQNIYSSLVGRSRTAGKYKGERVTWTKDVSKLRFMPEFQKKKIEELQSKLDETLNNANKIVVLLKEAKKYQVKDVLDVKLAINNDYKLKEKQIDAMNDLRAVSQYLNGGKVKQYEEGYGGYILIYNKHDDTIVLETVYSEVVLDVPLFNSEKDARQAIILMSDGVLTGKTRIKIALGVKA